ncbi:MAG: sensor histidine kinase KdpD [Gordonia sp. (in: high G+C Gram-positive bacteria)]
MMQADQARGRLQVFLGCAPGVGKTYEMLAQAKDAAADGVDVVVAVVESHGRIATEALVEGLEVVPRRRVEYRGATFEEMDLDAVLARRPAVALVDELAHTNVPGSRNRKRRQDIADLLAAGIDVWTTVNIQHLESLNDVVAQITGIVQRETVPDDVVRAADEVELVDISPEALRQRLSAGKIYPRGDAAAALGNYFRQGNLTALRELALLWLADQVDDNLAAYRGAHDITDIWEARERVVVALTGGAESATLLRRGSRIASRSSAELIAVHVVRGDGLVERGVVDMGDLHELAAGFGARIHTVVGDDVPTALLDFARSVNATQLVLGTSRRRRWQRLLDEGVGATVISRSGRIDVHMVTHSERGPTALRGIRITRPTSWAVAVVVPFAMTGVLALLDRWLGFASESALFFGAVLAVSMLGGVASAAVSAVLSGLLLNFFFTTPRLTFTISEPDNLITILVMLVVAVAVAVLVDSATVRTAQARRASREAELLTHFSATVLGGADLDALLEQVRETYEQTAVALVRTEPPTVEGHAGDRVLDRADVADTVCAVPGGPYVLLLAGRAIDARDRRVLSVVAAQAAGVVTRRRLEAEAADAAALAQTDELRRALLSAVSHDLRTPLAAAKAAVSSLRSDDVTFSADDTAELLATTEESLDQLADLVGNLLDSSRLAADAVRPKLRRTYLPEVIHRALAVTLRRHPGREVDISIKQFWAETDGGLLERVLANLVENALRHGGTDVELRVAPQRPGAPDRCLIEVIDHGPGIPVAERDRIFTPFHQYGDSGASERGVGLGLSVAQGFTAALGGTLEVRDTDGGGTTMAVELHAMSPGAS